MTTTFILLIWFILGVHSVYFLLYRLFLQNDEDIELTTELLFMVLLSFTLPIISHLATSQVFPLENNYKKTKIIIKKDFSKFNFLKKYFY